jgi:hypothetical protein
MNYSEKDYRKIGVIAAVAIAIAAMMIPGSNLANIAYAHGDSGNGNVVQSTDQSNSNSASNSGSGGSSHSDHNVQVNDAHNTANIHRFWQIDW